MQFVFGALRAIYAGLVAGLGALGTVLQGGASVADVQDGQWVTIALAVLFAFGGVYHLSNRSAS